MRHGNAPDPSLRPRRRHLLAALAVVLLLPGISLAADDKKKKGDPNKILERPPVNSPLLTIEAVTAPVSGNPPGTIIMTFTLDCGTVENAQQVDNLLPRAYNAVILELNREPLGRDGRVTDQDLEGMKRRLLYQVNRALRGPEIKAVLIRSLQEVPRRTS
jgi:hypothetical protein